MKKPASTASAVTPKPNENAARIERLQGALGHYLALATQLNLQPTAASKLLEKQYYDDLAQLAAQVGVAVPTYDQAIAQAQAARSAVAKQ